MRREPAFVFLICGLSAKDIAVRWGIGGYLVMSKLSVKKEGAKVVVVV